MIQLSDIMAGKNYTESGAILYDNIIAMLNDNQHIDIDLTGVASMPSIFLNASIGRIMQEYGYEKLKNITFHNITKVQAERLREYMQR